MREARSVDQTVVLTARYDGTKIIDWAGPAVDVGDEGAANFSVSIPGNRKVTLHAVRLIARY